MNRNFVAVDLFSGCGGFSFGFQEAGFHILCGVDNDPVALKTFELNHKNSKGLNIDLFDDRAIDDILKHIGDNHVDVIIGGPPCQGFSLTGTRNENDKRNKLFYSVFKLAEKLNPEAIVIENVPGLIKLYGGKAKDEILHQCELLGYNCTSKELFAPEYGVPQIRRRVFFVATKKEKPEFKFPEKTHPSERFISCEQAIGDLPSLTDDIGAESMSYATIPITDYQKRMRNGSKILANHVGTKHSDLVIEVIRQVPEGGNFRDLPTGVGESRRFNEAWTRYHSQLPSKTIDTGHRNHFHYKYDRVPTVRENARLQSFPDAFVFLGSKTQQHKQVGNAVPPILGKAIGDKLIDFLSC